MFPPFFIGYYQDQHYQSLEIEKVKEDMVRNKEKEKVNTFQPLPTSPDVMAISSSLKLTSLVVANTSSVSTATSLTVSSSAVDESPVTATPFKTPKKRGRPFGWRKVKGDESTKSHKKAKKDVRESETLETQMPSVPAATVPLSTSSSLAVGLTDGAVASSENESALSATPMKTPKKRGRPVGWRKVRTQTAEVQTEMDAMPDDVDDAGPSVIRSISQGYVCLG